MKDYRAMTDLRGKVAVVTGGSRGIGFECATALRENGATVVIAGRDQVVGTESARRLQADYLPLDIANAGQVKQLADTIVERYGRLDIAVNNAGQPLCVPAENCSDDQWQKMMNINLHALFYCSLEFALAMLRQGKATIVNVTSISGFISNVTQTQA